MRQKFSVCLILLTIIFLSSCVLPARLTPDPPSQSTIYAELLKTLTPQPALENVAESLTLIPSPRQTITPEKNTGDEQSLIFLHPGLPRAFISSLDLTGFKIAEDENDADLQLQLGSKSSSPDDVKSVTWIFVIAAPFYTLRESISMDALTNLWQGLELKDGSPNQIYVTPETLAAMNIILGPENKNIVKTFSGIEIEALALSKENILAIIPFENLSSQWKVLRVDQSAPIDTNFDPASYPLSVQIWSEGDHPNTALSLPKINYDPAKRTTIIMTGVTALTRATAYRMKMNGNEYPGQDIRDWLIEADITHISNEVSFASDCPFPDPVQDDLIFCSDPETIELLEFIGTDVIELSGNHLLDYGEDAIVLTLEMYQERSWETYAGGWDRANSQEPAYIIHNQNQLAFLGCNAAGPPNNWATETRPGSAYCGDYEWLIDEIKRVKSEGFLPIVTLQYIEDYTAYPSPQMIIDFQRLAEAGAVVVNGSQAHTPKSMAFYNGSFFHYGLGNLFFDQMEVYYNDTLMAHTREEFLDRLIFYDGRLISIELLTAMLEDYARPRPMTEAEREEFLSRIFTGVFE